MNTRRFAVGITLAALLGLALPGPSFRTAAQARNPGATITYQKVFKSSYPEYVEIKVSESGVGSFDIRQLDEQPNPQPLQVGAPTVQRIFDLSAKLRNFDGQNLNVHHKLASLGEKTFRYEKGADKFETKFNYTLDPNASQLLNIFEGLTRQEGDLSDLQRTMKYDRLGVNDVLMQIETDYNNKLIPEPELLLPSLDQLASDDKFLDIARQRARTLAGRIRGGH